VVCIIDTLVKKPGAIGAHDEGPGKTWAVVLAGGEGTRIAGLLGRPKQFEDFGTGRTLLGRALDRAVAVAAVETTLVVVAPDHRAHWSSPLREWRTILQPERRGTAAGLLLPLLRIARLDPTATIVVLPSDHWVEREEILRSALRRTVRAVRDDLEHVWLLGFPPDGPDPEYGWLVASRATDGHGFEVRRFVEKPEPAVAERLLLQGAFWNGFVLVGRVEAFLSAFSARLGVLRRALENALAEVPDDASAEAIEERLRPVYRALPSWDVSRDLLERLPERLRLVPVPACGWTDLGTPVRLDRFRLERAGSSRNRRVRPSRARAHSRTTARY